MINFKRSYFIYLLYFSCIEKVISYYVYNPLDWINGYYFPHVYITHANSLFSSYDLNPITLPPISSDIGAGLRTPLVLSQYIGTEVHHLITLPDDWSESNIASGMRWPVIVCYTGNYFPSLGSAGIILNLQ